MYSIYADDVCIYSNVFALESMKVISPKLTLLKMQTSSA